MSKRDRQGVRTPAGLERKYDFGSKFTNQSMTNMTTAERIVYLDRTMYDNQTKNDASVESLRTEDASIKQSVSVLSADTASALNQIDLNIGTLTTNLASLDAAKVNKTDVANDLTVTIAGKVADARTVKILNDKFKIVRRVVSVTLTANEYCKPFSYFGALDISADVNAYGYPVGVYLFTAASVPMACYYAGGAVRMASGEAENTLVVDYLAGGYQ
jgi:hypothetical protein